MNEEAAYPIRIDLQPGVYAEIDPGDNESEIEVGIMGHGGQLLCARIENGLASLTHGPCWPDGSWDEGIECHYQLLFECDWPTAERALDVVRTIPLATEPEEGGVVGEIEFWHGVNGDCARLEDEATGGAERTVPIESLRRRSWPPPSTYEIGRDYHGQRYPHGGFGSLRPPTLAWCPVHRVETNTPTRRATTIWYALPLEVPDVVAMLTARYQPPRAAPPQWVDEHTVDGELVGSTVAVVALADVSGDIDEHRVPRNARCVAQVTTWKGSA